MNKTNARRFYGWVVVAGVGLRHFASAGALWYSAGVFLPIFCEEFSWSRSVVSGAFSLRALLMGILGPIAGALMVKFGPRIVMVYAAIIGAIGLATMSSLNEMWGLYLGYGVLAGLGLAFSGVLGPNTVINSWFIKRRTLAIGVALAGGGVGGFAFPPFVAWLIATLGWRPTFWILAAILIVFGAIVGGVLIRNKPEDLGQVPDGISIEDNNGTETSTKQPAVFHKTPIDWKAKDALRTPTIWIIIFSGLSVGFANSSLLVHQVAYLQDIGLPPVVAASALGIIPGMSIFGRLTIGVLGTKVQIRYLAVLLAAIQVIAMIILLTIKTLPGIYCYSALLGITFGGFMVTRPTFIGAYYGRANFAQIMGWMMPFSAVFGPLGPIVTGAIYDITGAYQLAFTIMLILSLVGTVGYFFARPPKPPSTI